ncbi:MAG TPA: peptidoglycan-binding domain-containing protein [Pyrinomonadaceae bacterium]|nr:peptidoglycan-binding domain-containing protein [Pyrinomonadaceae bacterium]
MKRVLTFLLLMFFTFTTIAAVQGVNINSQAGASDSNSNTKKKRGPVFRATKEQIKQAQAILKQRGFYNGEQTGHLDADTRAGLKKYQGAEQIRVTGTLNRETLQKMGIELTERQRAM